MSMKVTIWKNDKESNERAITRFNKKVQSSRKLVLLRGKRFRAKPLTKTKIRAAAIKREHYRGVRQKNRFY